MRTATSPAGSDACARARQGRCGRQGGFTLLEVMLAAGILVLSVSLTLPALLRPSATELRTATGSVVAGLRRARDEAVSRGNEAVLTLDVAARRFTVSGVSGSRNLPQRVDLRLFTARGELEGDSRGRIRFFPDGSSTGGRVTLSSDQRHYRVDVDWLTGQVRVHAGSGDAPSDLNGQELRS